MLRDDVTLRVISAFLKVAVSLFVSRGGKEMRAASVDGRGPVSEEGKQVGVRAMPHSHLIQYAVDGRQWPLKVVQDM